VRALHQELVELGSEVVDLSDGVLRLQRSYAHHQVLGVRYRADMLHIALATVARVDLLVSWNFRHIVRHDKIRGFNRVNSLLGYRELATYSLREVLPDEKG
jgi:hypothetical protein